MNNEQLCELDETLLDEVSGGAASVEGGVNAGLDLGLCLHLNVDLGLGLGVNLLGIQL